MYTYVKRSSRATKPPTSGLLGRGRLTTNSNIALERASRGSHHLLEQKPLKLSASHDVGFGDRIAIVPFRVTRPKRENGAAKGPIQSRSDQFRAADRSSATRLGVLRFRHWKPLSQKVKEADSGGVQGDT